MLKAKPFLFIPNLCEKKHPPYDSHFGGKSLFLSEQEFLQLQTTVTDSTTNRSTRESLCPDVIRKGENI